MAGPPGTRPMRADARRNYERLLAEAGTLFVECGLEASLDEIARRSGVGIGTLYRHFPTREALLETLLRRRFETLTSDADELRDTMPADEALRRWLRAFVSAVTTYRGLTAALMTTLRDERSELHAACEALRVAGAGLLRHAQQCGAVRTDVSPSDLFLLVGGLAWAHEQADPTDPAGVERLLGLTFDGLTPRT